MKKYYLHREPHAFRVDYDAELNPEQHAAVMHGSGPALVLAGAGSGKTRVVTYRVSRLIESGTPAENILLLTFTNKAAREMMRRVESLIGRNVSGIFGGTFHHVANLMLRQHCQLAGFRQGFSILDREDSKDLLEACLAELYKKDVVLPKGNVLIEISSLAQSTERTVEDIVLDRFPHFTHVTGEIGKIVDRYGRKKQELNLLDFDDLLSVWKKILIDHERVRAYYRLKFRNILVDEYQDTNRLQADIVDLLAGEERNLMVVGDDAQSIYSFRGADFDNILRFPERYPGASVYTLTMNYRSTPEILFLANMVIRNNRRRFDKELRAVAPSGETPNLVPLRDVFEQAEFVSSVVMDLNADGADFDSLAVLYRSHYQSMELQMELQRRGIPFEVRSGLKFFELAHIKDVLSYLKIIANPYDEIAWKRVLKIVPGIGNVTAGKLWEEVRAAADPRDRIGELGGLVPKKAAKGFGRFLEIHAELRKEEYAASPSAAIEHLLRHGYEDHLYNTYQDAESRIEDVEQMAKFAARYDLLDSFLSEMTLQGVAGADDAQQDDEGGRVVLTTVHQAKGLEWDTVFIIGLNDGKFPSGRALKSDADEEEERRLFYVAVTRARKGLYLTYPVSSDDWSSVGMIRPSRFLRELPADCFEEISVEDV
ncbi:MAG: ATP-dependent helicase [Thermodesulfovibrionales bacterium]